MTNCLDHAIMSLIDLHSTDLIRSSKWHVRYNEHIDPMKGVEIDVDYDTIIGLFYTDYKNHPNVKRASRETMHRIRYANCDASVTNIVHVVNPNDKEKPLAILSRVRNQDIDQAFVSIREIILNLRKNGD